MLEVPREQYLRCARLRTEVCEAFADVIVSEKAAQESLPEQGVPEASPFILSFSFLKF